jgi:hypothetical protein
MTEILLKIHKSYRWTVAVCDKDIFGKKLQENNRTLDVSGNFFNGETMTEQQAKEEIVRCNHEDATFNFVGENSVRIAKELGLIKNEGIAEINNIPFALVLL